MAGNSQRRGGGHKSKSSAVGSGGRGRKALKGRGPTPKAEDRVYHKAYKAKQEKLARAAARKPANRQSTGCLLYTSPSPRDLSTSRMPSSA